MSQAVLNQSSANIDDSTHEIDKQKAWLNKVAEVCERAARGDLEVRLLNVDADEDLARTIHSINSLLDYTDAFIREAKAVLEYSAQGKFFRRVVLRGMNGAFFQASQVINSAAQEMQDKSKEIKQSNIRRLLMADEFDEKVNGVTNTVAATAAKIQKTSTSLSEAAQQTSRRSTSAMEVSNQAVENIRNVSDSTIQLQDAFSQIDEQVNESASVVQRAVSEANHAKEIVAGLEKSSSNIDTVVETITAISKQTELLALNAAIEAARAGDAGRGFAVVATEVRKLAEETRSATQNAKQEITSVQNATKNAVSSINGFSGTVGQINESTSMIAKLVNNQRQATSVINSNVTEVANRIDDVTDNIQHASSAADETAGSADAMLISSNELNEQASMLSASVEEFLQDIRA